MTKETLPRPFGQYVLTAALGKDALGAAYRATRSGDERSFIYLRVLETEELSAEPILEAIEENGEVHEFLKHAAIARGVDMDAVDGVPYVAWSQPNGRTLDVLIARCREAERRLPVEHALLIAEKIATALDHAYNTTIDGDRTLHGLVWPGFVALSDDGEIRLGGFGLASGILPSLRQPHLAAEIAPYVAPEERDRGAAGKNSDVYSVGVILLELLTGQPAPHDPLALVKGVAGGPPPPVLPEILAVLRMALAPAEARYRSSGDLRRELGKLLFSGPYSPSTFNLAYFLNETFRTEIDAETRDRLSDPLAGEEPRTAAPARSARPSSLSTTSPDPPEPPSLRLASAPHRGPLAAVGGILAVAAVAGGVYAISRRPAPPAPALRAAASDPRLTPTALPELATTPASPTSTMTEADFREEVARRLAIEVQKLEPPARRRPERQTESAAPAPAAASLVPAVEAPTPAPLPQATPRPAPAEPEPEPARDVRLEPTSPPIPAPPPTRIPTREGALVALESVDTPPRVARVVKPTYPPLALQARVGGIVLLRVLVSEKGLPEEISVVRDGRAGLTEAAVRAVREWTFDPAVKDGVPVKTWMSVPIPFQP